MRVTCGRAVVLVALVAGFLALFLAPTGAVAQTDAQTLARQHYQKGKELYEAQNYAEAQVEFQAAYDAKPHPVVLKSIAECQFQQGDLAGAIATFEKFLADPAASGKEQVQTRLDEIRKMVASVKITSEPPGAGVMLDGVLVTEVTPTTIDVAAGDHEFAFNYDGYEPLVKQVKLVGGEQTVVDVNFAREGVPIKAASEALVDPFADEEGGAEDEAGEELEEDSEGPPPAFWVCAAVAGVGLVSGTVFGTMALGDEEDYIDDPTQAKKDAGERDALIADVSFGLAAAAAVVGAVILITDNAGDEDDSAEAGAAAWRVTPAAGENGIGVNTSVTF